MYQIDAFDVLIERRKTKNERIFSCKLTCYADDDFNSILFFTIQFLSQSNNSRVPINAKYRTGYAISNVSTIWISSYFPHRHKMTREEKNVKQK